MLNKTTKAKIIASLLLATVILTSGVTVLAHESKAVSSDIKTTAYSEKANWTKHKGKQGFSSEKLKTRLEALVKDGTITEAQVTQITDYFKTKEAERKAEMEKVKNMTEAERKAYFEQKKAAGRPDFLKELVDKNIINQTQADAIKKVLPSCKDKLHVDFKEKLNSAVENKTITQEQADKISSYLEAKKAERKAEMDKVKNMTEEQRKAYFEQKKTTAKPDLFKDLVDQKIVSQSQADALKKLFFPAGKKEFKNFKR